MNTPDLGPTPEQAELDAKRLKVKVATARRQMGSERWAKLTAEWEADERSYTDGRGPLPDTPRTRALQAEWS